MSAPTAFQQLRNALRDHLDLALAATMPVPVHAGSARPIAQEETAAVNLRLSDSQALNSVIQANDWHTTVLIDCAARSVPGGDHADDAADALLGAVFAALHGLTSSGLGVLDMSDAPTVEWDHVADDVPYTCATLRITVVHRTPAATLQPWT